MLMQEIKIFPFVTKLLGYLTNCCGLALWDSCCNGWVRREVGIEFWMCRGFLVDGFHCLVAECRTVAMIDPILSDLGLSTCCLCRDF